MAEQDSSTLSRIESKIDRLGELINDLAQRVTRLETSEGSRANEVERRFSQLETRVQEIDTIKTELAQAKGAIALLRWISGAAGAAGLAGGAAAIRALLGGG